MLEKVLLLSIKPEWVREILIGRKTAELRTRIVNTGWPVRALIYETSPASRVRAWCTFNSPIKSKPRELWEKVKDRASVSREFFDEYFKGRAHGFALPIVDVQELKTPISLMKLQKETGTTAPQGIVWAKDSLIEIATLQT